MQLFLQLYGIIYKGDINGIYKPRTIIYLYYYENYKINQISKIIRVNENTVKSRLARARQKLKQDLEGGLENE